MAAVMKPTPVLKGESAKAFVRSLNNPKIDNRSKDFLVDCARFIKKKGNK